MSSDPLDDLLRRYGKSSARALPDSIAPAVWREIDARRRRRFAWAAFADWSELVRARRIAIAGCAAAVIASALPVVIFRTNDVSGRARSSLHLEVFSTRPPQTPSALMGPHQHP